MGAAEVVGADQDHGGFRLDARDLSMLDAPDQARGSVTLEAEVHRVAVAVEVLPLRREIHPGRRSLVLPVLGYRVTQEYQRGVLLGQLFQLGLVASAPPRQIGAADRYGGQD